MNICTIIAKNYVAHARVLAESFTQHHPDGRCFTLIIDDFTPEQIDPASEPFEVVRPADLSLAPADFDDMRARYSVLEFSTAVKPWLLEYMLEQQNDGSGIAYFDPDIRVYSRMEELEAALQSTQIVLTPHLTKPLPRDGMKPSETDIMIAGIYNLGFIGLAAGEETDELLQFWKERLRTDCWVAPERGLFVDQKWIDWIPGLLTDITILRTPTYNVAYWNVPTRSVERNGTGYTVDEQPLRFFHYSGYSPDHPTLFSKHQNRISLVPGSPLAELCEGYGERLLANDFEAVRTLKYSHDVLPSGAPLDSFTRVLYRSGADAGVIEHSIFTPAGEVELVAWMNQAEPATPGLTRYLREVWNQRIDLQRAYPEVDGADLHGYLGWCRAYGQEQIPIPPHMLDAQAVTTSPAAPAASATAVAPDAPSPAAPPAPKPQLRPFGVNVAGYLRSELGIGEVARQMTRAIDLAGIPAMPHALHAPNSRQGHSFATGVGEEGPYPINLVFVNADGLPAFAKEAPRFFEGRRSIGYWWWELDSFPENLHASFDLIDEVWVGSEFVAETLRQIAPVPVVKMPVPIDITAPPPLAPGALGWPSDRFSFFFSWDYNSVFRRKNPLALVEAYKRAFDPGDGAALVLKCINGDRDADNHELLRQAIAGRDDIVLIDRYVLARDKDRLMATCDCYVSLHRSEGLGLTMAEAMALGKPVIATNYAGNTDFMTVDNSYLVDFTMTKVGAGAFPYDAEAQWAEPDVEHAAQLMREVFDDPEAAREQGARGAATIKAQYSPEAVAQQIGKRLATYRDFKAPLTSPPLSVPQIHDSIGSLVDRGTTPRTPSRFSKPGAAARKAVLRGIKPYTAYQADVNRGLLDRIDRVYDTSVQLAHQSAEDVARLQLNHAEDLAAVLHELRQQRHTLSTLVEAISHETTAREETFEAITGDLEYVVGGAKATPFMEGDALSAFEVPGVGKVFGYAEAAPMAPESEDYRHFEDLFRGSEAFIAERQKRYLPLLDRTGPVVDIGCGRGEFLDLLAAEQIDAIGVDSDLGMVERCRAKGHERTVHGDALEYLKGCEDGSLGTIFSAQVIEHIPASALRELLSVARSKLRPGGQFIAETVNPHSVAALKTFWVDVTHQHPLFPEAMVAFCRIAGFSTAYAFYPNGEGDVDVDRLRTGEYAVVATA